MGMIIKTLSARTVVTAGTRVSLSATPLLVYDCVVHSLQGNTGVQYLGDDTVSSTNGMPFRPGESVEVEAPRSKSGDQFDISKVYIDSSTNGAEFRIIAWIRE